MRIIGAIALSLALLACGGGRRSSTAPGNRDVTRAPAAVEESDEVPAEVGAFIERWELCHHWAGEEPYDAARAADIQAGIDASCPGNDVTLADLEARYADRPEILVRLHALPE